MALENPTQTPVSDKLYRLSKVYSSLKQDLEKYPILDPFTVLRNINTPDWGGKKAYHEKLKELGMILEKLYMGLTYEFEQRQLSLFPEENEIQNNDKQTEDPKLLVYNLTRALVMLGDHRKYNNPTSAIEFQLIKRISNFTSNIAALLNKYAIHQMGLHGN